jgi:UDP-N-acetylglucosamine 1-carboxyvinyltransferase
MDRISIVGGTRLEGRIAISGAKNAALPLMVASLLTEEPLLLANVPNLADITHLKTILAQHGVAVSAGEASGELRLAARTIASTTAPYDLVRKMRASFLVIGPLLARCHEAIVSLPGGCAIGTRPVDLHLKGLEAMGAEIRLEEGYVHAKAPGGLKGAQFEFPFVSVGATENLLMAATLARGTTELLNAALEPEIGDLANCLVAMGADISGIGTRRLSVRGRTSLGGARHKVVPDRIETGTFAIAVGMTGGEVQLENTDVALLGGAIPILVAAGIEIEPVAGGLSVRRGKNPIEAVDMTTETYPGFPTDLQAQFMALMCRARGTSRIRETIFENRFMHAPELMRMGAVIRVEGDTAIVTGADVLHGAPVMATDLRASVSLVIAGLAAEGETTINRVYHLDRGFERLEEKLGACGANIRRLKD